MKNKIEILSPAGSMKSLKTAILNGADAVYFGMSSFNARRNADNFKEEEEIKEATDFCHLYNKKAYLTFNTTIYESEIKLGKKELIKGINLGFDAIIVQDFASARLISEISDIPLHASTQLSAHSVFDVLALKNMGFSRVVLARELSLKEIENIIKNVDIEVEVFLHGALCMCISGQCYFSGALGDRSGNRGLCAGVCRLPFYVENKNNYNLSLKDVSLIKHINALKEIGVTSLKIEGRMKAPEYVKGVTKEVSNYLISGEYDEKFLLDLFSRQGFTDSYLKAALGRDMFGVRTSLDKENTKEALKNISLKDNTSLVPLILTYDFSLGKEALLKLRDDDFNEVEVKGDIIQKAKNKPLTKEDLEKSLCKLGGSPYYKSEISGTLEEGAFISVSSINELRRKGIEKLKTLRIEKYSPKHLIYNEKIKEENIKTSTLNKKAKNIAIFEGEDTFNEALLEDFDLSFIPIEIIEKLKKDTLIKYKEKIGAILPRVYFKDEKSLISKLEQIKILGITKGLAHTVGKVKVLEDLGYEIYLGYGMNILNSGAINFLTKEYKGIKNVVINFESSLENVKSINVDIKKSIIVYGHIPLMITRNCPIKIEKPCNECKNKGHLTDRRNVNFPVRCREEYINIYNSIPLYIADKVFNLESVDKVFLFTVESYLEIKEVLKHAKKGETLKDITRGSYFKKML